MHIVLVQPEIPPNTGNVARLCAATNSTLHLVGPLGFKLDDRQLKRAGLDYWEHVKWKDWKSWDEFKATTFPSPPPFGGEGQGEGARLWLVENKTDRAYTSIQYRPDDYLVFGSETTGLPAHILEAHRETMITIPQANPNVRSLNLSNCVAIVLYEALRQLQA